MDDMTLEQFRDYVIFQLLDIPVPDGFDWVAVDSDGEVYVYHGRPFIRDGGEPTFNDEGEQTSTNHWTRNSSNEIFACFPKGSPDLSVHVTIPFGIHWRDCSWML